MKGTRIKDLRKLSDLDLQKKLGEIENSILTEKKSPKLRPLKKAVARIKTILHQKETDNTKSQKIENATNKEVK